MEGIGLENVLSPEEVERRFSDTQEQSLPEGKQENGEGNNPQVNNETNSNPDTAEVDFSDLLGNPSESVGSGKNTGGNGGAPESNNDKGSPQSNLFSSITRILRDKGVFPDLSDDTVDGVTTEEALEQLFNDKVSNMLDERQKRIEKALDSGATSDEMKEYQNALSIADYLSKRETYNTLLAEGEEGEKLRKQVMYQDYINRGFRHERAVKLVEKSIEEGNDIEDAKDAFKSCEDFYKEKIEEFQDEMESRKKKAEAEEEKQYSNLKKNILEKESFYGGVKVDKNTRQKAYDAATKAVYKDEQGNYLTALQKYQRENPMEFVQNLAMFYALTDGFKSVEKLTKAEVKAGLKKGFSELESVLNNTRRNADGTLDLANSAPDLSDRDNWELAK